MAHLALDTSGAVAVALVDADGTRLAARRDDQQRHHAELLAPMVEGVLADAGSRVADVDAVVVGTGPAPFTGLRVGLVSARTLALALGVRVLGVPSLDALAASASRRVSPGTHVLVASDARRREVYWALYRADGPGTVTTVAEPAVASAEEAVAAARVAARDAAPDAEVVVVGRGPVLYPDAFLGLPSLDGLLDPDPVELALLAQARDVAGEPLPTEPLYLRRPDAVPSAARKRVG